MMETLQNHQTVILIERPLSNLKFADDSNQLNACILDIRSWMITNKLKTNDNKTKLLVITSRYAKLPSPGIMLDPVLLIHPLLRVILVCCLTHT